MDSESGQEGRMGGTLERATHRGTNPRTRNVEVPEIARYELRDPFAEVTYRAKTLQEMALQAERLGALRFHAVAADGTRIPVEKSDGEWKRSDAPVIESAGSAAPKVQPTMGPARSADSDPVLARIEAEAAHAARLERIERELNERYVIKRAAVHLGTVIIGQTEYRYRGDTARVAFTESTFRLATDNNSPSVARSMVDVSEARHWQALRVSGHEDFRRMVWLEASLRGINIIGYEPNQADRELLRKEREARQVNRIEPSDLGRDVADGTQQSGRGSGGRKAVLAALEAVLVAKRVPARQREAVMAAAADNLAARLRNGETHKIKVYDKTAPVQRPAIQREREVQRTQDRASPSR